MTNFLANLVKISQFQLEWNLPIETIRIDWTRCQNNQIWLRNCSFPTGKNLANRKQRTSRHETVQFWEFLIFVCFAFDLVLFCFRLVIYDTNPEWQSYYHPNVIVMKRRMSCGHFHFESIGPSWMSIHQGKWRPWRKSNYQLHHFFFVPLLEIISKARY